MRDDMIARKFDKLEKYVFLTVIAISLLPVLTNMFLPTMDGAAHLYNSNLINALLFENNPQIHEFFVLNQEPVPNWIGHFILAVFNLFLPSFVAEKILVLFYLIAFPLSFRALLKTIHPENYVVFSYLIFPFSYSFLFLLGFYNFSIALLLLFITLNYWIKNEDHLFSKKSIFVLFLLTTLTYFSHIFIFGLLLFFIGVHIVTKAVMTLVDNYPLQVKEAGKSVLKKSGIVLLSAFVPLLLLLNYFLSRDTPGNANFLEYSELIKWLKEIRPIIVYDFVFEATYTKKIFYVLMAMTVVSLYLQITGRFFSRGNPSPSAKGKIVLSNFWMVLALSMLLFYFVLPDSDGAAGFVSVRLGLLFFIVLIIWLSTQRLPKWFTILGVLVVLYCNLRLTVYYSSVIRDLDKVAVECYEMSEQIAPNSVVLPLNYSDNWLAPHFSNYLGVDKPMVILENYECATGYFPVKWNEAKIPATLLGTTPPEQYSCLEWKSNAQSSLKKPIDYVFILGDIDSGTDSCTASIKENLEQNYSLISKTENSQLFKRKT